MESSMLDPLAVAAAEPDHRSARLFHHIGVPQLGRAVEAMAAGSRVVCLTADPDVASRLGSSLVLGSDALLDFDLAEEVDGFHDLLGDVYGRLDRESGLFRQLTVALRSRDVELYLKRALMWELARLVSLASLAASSALAGFRTIEVDREWPHFQSCRDLADLVRSAGGPAKAVVNDLDRLVFPEADHGSRRLRLRGAAVCTLRVCYHALRPVRLAGRGHTSTPLLLRVYATDWGVGAGGQSRLRNVDFLVDGEDITAAEVGVWLEHGVSEIVRDRLAARGYRLLDPRSLRIGMSTFARVVAPRLRGLPLTSLYLARSRAFLHEAVAQLWIQYLRWIMICDHTRPAVFVAYNELQAVNVARNIALRQSGCTSIDYEFSSHWTPGPETWRTNCLYEYTNVDVLATWGPRHSAVVRRHRARIGRLLDVGCLWSEHARLVRETPALQARYAAAVEEETGVRVRDFERAVGVFDTSLNLLGPDDLTRFYAGIGRLAGRHPRVLFAVKPKNDRTFFPGGGDGTGRNGVAGSPQCPANLVVLPTYFETSAVIALSDLTVNACFTSTAVETIGVGTPALYYDPTSRFPDAFWHRYPGLVVDDSEIEGYLEHLLSPAGLKEWTDGLRDRFGDLEGHFDGRAITRLRTSIRAVIEGRTA